MTDLADAHVLVLGATGGLGAPICRRLTTGGARLTVSARDAGRLGELDGFAVPADLTRPDAPAAVVAAAVDHHGPLTGIVYAAGVVAFGPAESVDDDVLDDLVLLNFLAPVRVFRAARPSLVEGGFLANISAVLAEKPMPGMAAYSATKAALTAWDAAVATELRRARIRVVDVRPPHTETGLATRPIAGEAPKLPQGLEPDAVAERIVRAITDDEKSVASTDF